VVGSLSIRDDGVNRQTVGDKALKNMTVVRTQFPPREITNSLCMNQSVGDSQMISIESSHVAIVSQFLAQ
jgi:hypothetical protein